MGHLVQRCGQWYMLKKSYISHLGCLLEVITASRDHILSSGYRAVLNINLTLQPLVLIFSHQGFQWRGCRDWRGSYHLHQIECQVALCRIQLHYWTRIIIWMLTWVLHDFGEFWFWLWWLCSVMPCLLRWRWCRKMTLNLSDNMLFLRFVHWILIY